MRRVIVGVVMISVVLGCSSSDPPGAPAAGDEGPASVDATGVDAPAPDAAADDPGPEPADAGPDVGPPDPCAACDDGNPCTIDGCEAGECTHSWNDACCFADEECEPGYTCVDNSCTADLGACTGQIGVVPDGLLTLEWHDGAAVGDITGQTWTVTDAGLPLATEPIYEASRFELKHPARVHAFSVRFGQLPSLPGAAVELGLYPDFGHNGFDFWQKDPYWTGAYCAAEIDPDDWVVYVLDEPVEIDHPSLVYVAHRRAGDDDAALLFDGSSAQPDGSCPGWDDCHSSINLPELHTGVSGGQGFSAWNGLSFPFQLDFLIRLHIEYLDDVAPEERLFQPDEAPGLSNRASFGDFDNDGDDDVFTAGNKLFENVGGVLTDVTAETGIGAMGIGGSGGVWGDYDNDGCMDLFVFVESGTSPDSLLRGACDGTFVNVTEEAGIVDTQIYNDCAGAGHQHAPSPAAAWWDIDSDGLLDIYVANMICWSDYSFYNDQIWRNNGDNTFSEWTGSHGFAGYADTARSSRGANPVDYDGDGHVDLLVNRYTLHENALYKSNGDGTVENVASAVGAAGHKSTQGYYGHSIGTAWGDLDGDGDFDAVIANLAHPRFFGFSDKTQVLLQDGGEFTDIQGDFSYPHGAAGIRYQETHSIPSLGDFDHDGDLDLIITATYPGRPTGFYWGQGDGTFVLDNYHAGFTLTSGWGVALADLDHDGDLDAATSGGVYRNVSAADGHWLQVRAIGNVDSNRAAIGATIRVQAGGKTWVRYVSGGNGQGGQDSQTAHVGLADAEVVDAIQVSFPGGATVDYPGPHAVDQRVWVYEDGAVSTGWAP